MTLLAQFPYFRQETDVTCGPAVLRMIFAHFGVEADEAHLAHEMHTSKKDGTHHRWLLEAPCHHGLHVYAHKSAALIDLQMQLAAGHPVIVHYIEPSSDEEHYSVVIGIDEHFITMNDPWLGPGYRISIEEFERRWHDKKNRFPSWMMAVSNAQFSLGIQRHPQGCLAHA